MDATTANIVYPNANLALVAGRHGVFIVNRNDIYIGAAVELYGEFSELEARCLQQFISRGDCVIDVGANMGMHTVMFARAVGLSGRVQAFEPQAELYSMLRTQLVLNGLHNVIAHEQAIGAASGTMFCPVIDYAKRGSFGSASMAVTNDKPSTPIKVATLDEHMDKRRIALIKIDVEGMELDVLRGASKLIERDRPILYVENDRREKSFALVEHILGLGYRMWWHLPPLFNPDNYFGIEQNIFPGLVSANMLCIRDRSLGFAGLREIKSPSDPHPI